MAESMKAKLSKWEVSANEGIVIPDDVDAAMAELHRVALGVQTTKKYLAIITGACGLAVLFLVGVVTSTVDLSSWGQLDDSRPSWNCKPLLIKTQDHSMESMKSKLSVDQLTDEWTVSSNALRDLDAVTFELANGSYYDKDVVEVIREDSGPDAEGDKLEIVTSDGGRLRMWEAVGTLEAKWPGTPMWETLNMNDAPREDLDVDLGGRPAEYDPPEGGSLRPPGRLLAKGAGGGTAGYGAAGRGVGGVGARGAMGGRAMTYGLVGGAVVGTMFIHRPYHYGRRGSRECYADEKYEGGKCRKNAACDHNARARRAMVGAVLAAAIASAYT